jgi:thioredoxin-related protein
MRFASAAMRALFAVLCACLLLLSAHNGVGRAAVESKARTTSMELVVFEHPDCTYCPVFRRDVAPSYALSPPATEAPLRYIDIAKSDIGGMRLKGRIDMVPTAVLMKDGQEVGRIAGYWGRESFFKMLAYIMSTAE